jgi:aminoglycoside 3-N-acetyltransferase
MTVRDLARPLVHGARRAWRRLALRLRGPVTIESLARDLRGLGMREGELVLVHSSLGGLGWTEGGPETVIRALLLVLGPRGTLLMPVYPMDRPTKDWLDTDPIYDPRSSPSRLGAISEMFRSWPGVVHGDHPTHPVAGLGPLADEVLRAHGWTPGPYGERSAYAELARRGGRIVALGSPFSQVSSFHVVEEAHPAFPEAVYLPGTRDARVRLADGSIESRPVRVMDPSLVPRRFDVREAWRERVLDECRRRGAVTTHRAGHGIAYVFDAARMLDALMRMADEGLTIYEPAPASASSGASASSAQP